ncbi:MAG TPA: ABC transporter substrate-binding protein [Candidatus Acidoferrales bacterium]|nr:ABC transporter substrate-binding protein [Candidatus Acidoferrales bacterium]
MASNLRSQIQSRKWAGFVAVVSTFAMCGAVAQAQQPATIPRIGYLVIPPLSALTYRTDAFRKGLRELGYLEGKNIVIQWRTVEGRLNRLPTLATELVRLNVDVIVSGGPAVTRVLKEATSTLPIIMAQDSDPVGNGFVASLARPRGNITGLSTLTPEIRGKQLELLKEIVPKISRVAVFQTSNQPGNAQAVNEVELAAGAFGVKLLYLDLVDASGIDNAFRAANGRSDAVLMMASGRIVVAHRERITEWAIKTRLPVIYERIENVEAGGLMSYGVNFADLDRRAATYVDKILKGAKPADLPVEQPTKFEFIVNLKAAKQIGLTIPPTVLARADRVIK